MIIGRTGTKVCNPEMPFGILFRQLELGNLARPTGVEPVFTT